MSIVRITMYQKAAGNDASSPIVANISQLKSDFLILPEYFGADSSVKNPEDLKHKSEALMENLQVLSESYKGVIIAGGIFTEEKGSAYTGAALVSGGDLIDIYKKRNLTAEESNFAVPGEDCGIFILAGQRFSILLGDEIFQEELLKEIIAMGITWIINPAEGSSEKKDSNAERLAEACSRHGLYIVRCMPSGIQFGRKIYGRSLIVTPAGVNWKLSEQEETKEIIKTVNLNFPN